MEKMYTTAQVANYVSTAYEAGLAECQVVTKVDHFFWLITLPLYFLVYGIIAFFAYLAFMWAREAWKEHTKCNS